MKLTISVDNLSVIKLWIDAPDRTHMDCKGHTGYAMYFGKGAMVSYLRKQKINTKRSTEPDLMGMDDALPMVLWAVYFMEAQVYIIEQNIGFQETMFQ